MDLERVLQRINKFITLKPDDRSVYAEDFNAVSNFLLQEMREINEVFSRLFNGPNLGGSYADNLKISRPDEYDLVFRLKIRPSHLVRVERDPQRPGNVLININDVLKTIEKEKHNEQLYKQLQKLVDEKGFLIQNKVQSWIEGIVTVALQKKSNGFQKGRKTYKLQYRKCGPAHTLFLEQENRIISIDFVPGFVFGKEIWPVKRKCPINAKKTDWIAIPKPIKNCSGPNRSFRASFVDTEQDFINNKNNLKNTLRMLKKLRDRQNIQNLKSYYIKTVFLWEIEKVPEDFWSTKSVTFVLMHMFEVLLNYVEKRTMPFFWNEKCDMFSDLNENQLNTMFHQLRRCNDILKKYPQEKNPNKVYEIFLTDEEINSMNTGGTKEEANERSRSSDCTHTVMEEAASGTLLDPAIDIDVSLSEINLDYCTDGSESNMNINNEDSMSTYASTATTSGTSSKPGRKSSGSINQEVVIAQDQFQQIVDTFKEVMKPKTHVRAFFDSIAAQIEQAGVSQDSWLSLQELIFSETMKTIRKDKRGDLSKL